LRNVYTAAAPAFAPVRLTSVTRDDGIELSDLRISDDGATVVFVRGTQPNREGWVANPTADPNGAQRTIWAASTAGGGAWKLGDGTTPALSPDGKTVLFSKDGQIYRYTTARGAAPVRLKPDATYVRAWGNNSNPVWSPDGKKFAFVSDRVDHSLIGVYD